MLQLFNKVDSQNKFSNGPRETTTQTNTNYSCVHFFRECFTSILYFLQQASVWDRRANKFFIRGTLNLSACAGFFVVAKLNLLSMRLRMRMRVRMRMKVKRLKVLNIAGRDQVGIKNHQIPTLSQLFVIPSPDQPPQVF